MVSVHVWPDADFRAYVRARACAQARPNMWLLLTSKDDANGYDRMSTKMKSQPQINMLPAEIKYRIC